MLRELPNWPKKANKEKSALRTCKVEHSQFQMEEHSDP